MSLDPRDIIAQSHFEFKGGYKDPKSVRFCLMLLTNINGREYYLTLATHNGTANSWFESNKDSTYLLNPKRCPGLPELSCVNLKDIYDKPASGDLVVIVPDEEFQKIVKKFIEFHSKNPNELYERISAYLKY